MVTSCQSCGASLDSEAHFCPACGARRGTPAPVSDPMIGRTIIGQYVIKAKLGEGGMGAVYLADQPSVGRQAVIKVMHPSLSRDETVALRFGVEAKAASQLNHPHIVTIYNYGAMEDGTLFLAMEYCNGSSLEELVRGGAVSAGRATAIGVQICDALAEAHRRGVVHRDLKPSNIMLTEVGRQRDFAKVLDFGIAKLEGVKMTRTGSVVGTPQYMSPEQLRGDPLDGRSDLYSLGVMLYELCAGQLPFKSDSAAGYMHKHLNEAPVSPTKIRQNIPRGLGEVILRALAKNPAARFQDADAMGQALEQAGAGAAAAPAPPKRRRGLGLWLAVGGSVLVAIGATVALLVVLRAEQLKRAPAPGASSKERVTWRPLKDGSAATGTAPLRPDAAPPPGATKVAAVKPDRRKTARRRLRRDKRVELASSKTTDPPAEAKTKQTPPPFLYSQPSAGGPPRPKAGRYDTMSADQLEAELKRVIGNAKVPPSTVDKTFQSYQQALSRWPAARREQYRRSYLVPLIKAYKRPSLQFRPNERKSLPRLRAIFMTMQTKANLAQAQRAQILDNALATYDRGNFPAQDRVFYKRVALIGMIKAMAVDPAQALR